MRISHLVLSSLLALLLGFSFADEPDRPNIVLINADDLGYGDVGCYGATLLQTPNIDRIAKEGRRFTDAHASAAVCSPSRFGLLTGQYPIRKNFWGPTPFTQELTIDTEQPTIASVLKSAGYSTAVIGKWHLGFGKGRPNWNGLLKPGPLELGFDYYFGVPVVNSHPPFVYVENYHVQGLVPEDPFVFGKAAATKAYPEKMQLKQIGGADAAHALYDDEAVGTELCERSVKWIKANKEQPFFLLLSTTNIHHPFTPAKRFIGTSDCGLYGDFVHELDWIVGEVRKTLEEEGLTENTLVLFTSDNGGMINVTGQEAIRKGHQLNGDLLGFKFDAWEGGHRVPFIASWPGRIEAGSVSDQLICNVDLLATMAALTGQKLKDEDGPDSIDVLPALTGTPEQPLRDNLVLSAAKGSHLVYREGDWVLITGKGGGGFSSAKPGSHGFGGPAALTFAGQRNSDVVNGKLRPNAPPVQLYNLSTDIHQRQNLAVTEPEKTAAMSKGLAAIKRKEAP